MARTYDVAVAALAIGAPRKWVDNTCAHHNLLGNREQQRGVARAIPYQVLLRLAATYELHTRLGLSVADAVRIAATLLDSESLGVYERGHLRVALDRSALERALDSRLRHALESAPAPRRGRPPKTGGRTSRRNEG